MKGFLYLWLLYIGLCLQCYFRPITTSNHFTAPKFCPKCLCFYSKSIKKLAQFEICPQTMTENGVKIKLGPVFPWIQYRYFGNTFENEHAFQNMTSGVANALLEFSMIRKMQHNTLYIYLCVYDCLPSYTCIDINIIISLIYEIVTKNCWI